MNSFNQNSPFQPAKPKTNRRPVNFVEALKSIGGQTVSSLKNDVIKGTVTNSLNSVFSPNNQPSRGEVNPNQWNQEWLQQSNKEADWQRELMRRERHKEVTQIQVFDRREEEVKQQIKALQEELKALAKDMANLSKDVVKAIDEEIAHPGTYHLNFFAKLRNYLALLRKQAAESADWLQLSYARKKSQNAFWTGFAKAGTKFSLSSERTVSMAG